MLILASSVGERGMASLARFLPLIWKAGKWQPQIRLSAFGCHFFQGAFAANSIHFVLLLSFGKRKNFSELFLFVFVQDSTLQDVKPMMWWCCDAVCFDNPCTEWLTASSKIEFFSGLNITNFKNYICSTKSMKMNPINCIQSKNKYKKKSSDLYPFFFTWNTCR